ATVVGMPAVQALSASPMLTTPSAPISVAPLGQSGSMNATAAMGSTMLASETSTVPLGQTNSSKGNSSGKLVSIVAGAVVVIGLIGVGAFFGLRDNGRERRHGALPDPLPSATTQSGKTEPTVATNPTPVAMDSVAPQPSATTATTVSTAPTTHSTTTTTKTNPTGTTKTKKPNDDDLMSGRK
ncbi:MAG TPA: hypothetical protein PKA58_35750, partial [Polyangium sp.]|nr:hypothetical protein [Polyangium sp.]